MRPRERKLIPTEQCQKVVNHYPERCGQCGHELEGEDPPPVRHQVVEIPPVEPCVEEHRLHQLACPACGTVTRASLPAEVSATGYGPGGVARVAVLSGVYRASERLTQAAMEDLFGVQMSLGTVNKLRQEASQKNQGSGLRIAIFWKTQGSGLENSGVRLANCDFQPATRATAISLSRRKNQGS